MKVWISEVSNSANSPTFRPPPRTKEILVRGQTVKLKYCFTCKIFRPPRASHCSLCDNCVGESKPYLASLPGSCCEERSEDYFSTCLIFTVKLAIICERLSCFISLTYAFVLVIWNFIDKSHTSLIYLLLINESWLQIE